MSDDIPDLVTRLQWATIATGFLVLGVLSPTHASAQTPPEVIRGQITDIQQRSVAGATVIVTGEHTQSTHTAQTNSEGRFVVLFSEGEGSYTVLVRKIGFAPSLRRVMRSGALYTITVDAVLAVSAYPLEPITVRSLRLPQSSRPERKSIGGVTQDALDGGAFLDDPSDLNALVALLPGVQGRGDSGYSVLGSSPEQNSALLDGSSFDGGPLPPDAACGVTLATTTSDPSRGQFAGGQTSVSTCRGREYFAGALRASLADPHFGWADDASAISPSRLGSLTGYLSGPLREGVAHYRLSVLGFEQRTETPTLLTPRGTLLSRLGLSVDTIAAATGALQSLGIPLTAAGGPATAQYRTGSALLNIDWNPGATSTLLLTASGAWFRRDAIGIDQQAFPSVGGRSRTATGRIAIRGSTLIHGLIDEFSGVLSAAETRGSPYLAASAGTVLAGTELAGESRGLTALRFGGGRGESASNRRSFELKHQLSWPSPRGSHRLTFGQQLGVAQWSATDSGNVAGVFGYQTLADLEANRPSTFSRTLGATERTSRLTSVAFWLGDVWRVSNAISLEGGVRLDAIGTGSPPRYNAAVDSLFGARTDRMQGTTGLTPRLGFAWQIKRRTAGTARSPVSGKLVTMEYIDVAELTGEARGNVGAGVTLFGNVGGYRGTLSSQRIASLRDETGLPGTTRFLACSGDATPVPNWTSSNGGRFSSCRDGSASTVFSDLHPTVTVLDRGFRPPIGWRGDLGLTGVRFGGWEMAASALVSFGRNEESRVDLNLQRDGGFSLPSEGNRPVFASPADITPETGIIAPGAGRQSDGFGRVYRLSSDLTNRARQLNLTLWTPRILNRIPLRIDYSYNHLRQEQRGLEGSTAGKPWQVESVGGSQPTHQFVITTGAARIGWFTTGLRLNLQSGSAFTPLVVGDINGDGVSNDRAFILDPLQAPGSELASEMSSLLEKAPGFARRCLQEQFGNIAGANSCRGPWQARFDLVLNVAQPPEQGGSRFHATVRLLNAGAALMRLAGLPSGLSQGSLPPDGRLLYVTGFDPAARQFRYRVNQHFGEPIGAGGGGRNFPPFQLQLGVEWKLGGPSTHSSLDRLGLTSGKGAVRSREQVRFALHQAVRNPVDTLLALSDSLSLSDGQLAALRVIGVRYLARADSLLDPVVNLVLARGKSLDDAMFFGPWRAAVEGIGPFRTEARNKALLVLNEGQKQKLQALIR